MNGPVLVTGATGRQGGAVVRRLLAGGWTVRALTRDPDKAGSRSLSELGATPVKGDMDDPASLRQAMTGAYGVFSAQDYWSVGADREVAQGKAVADVAKEL